MLSIVVVRTDNWQWLYVEGVLRNEGHEILISNVIYLINVYLLVHDSSLERIEFKTKWIDENYAENGCPTLLTDIPQEMIIV